MADSLEEDKRALRRTRWYHNLTDELRVYFDRKIDEMEYQTECPDCGCWYESWEVNEHIARAHHGWVIEDE